MRESSFASLEHLGFPEPVVDVQRIANGGWLLRSPLELNPSMPSLIHALRRHAESAPERIALAEKDELGDWRNVSYGEFWEVLGTLAGGLRDICCEKPVMILSGNSIEHAWIRYAAMGAGIAAAPVSTGYSLMSRTYERLQHVYEICTPGALFVQDTAPFETAIESLGERPPIIAVRDSAGIADYTFAQLCAESPQDLDLDQIDADQPAQIMFTSGSTGLSKGVVHTHRNLVSCVEQSSQIILGRDFGTGPESSTNWLPWNHVSGTNVLQISLYMGDTFYIDHGRPVPGLENKTLEILREVPISYYVSVPVGYEKIVDALEEDSELATNFFKNLRLLIFGGAGISHDTFGRFDELSQQYAGRRVPFMSAYGSTETTGSITFTYFDANSSGLIGLPVAGVDIKLEPHKSHYELLVKGPNVTSGYLSEESDAFDGDGFYRTGDIVDWVDVDDFNKGLAYVGRRAEEFKLRSGTWVSSARLRLQLLDVLGPLGSNVVICGLNRQYVAALVWLDADACRELDADFETTTPWLSDVVVKQVRSVVAAHNRRYPGSSTRIQRIRLMTTPLSADCGEISDKGTVCTSAVLQARESQVDEVYGPGGNAVIAID